MLLNVFLTVLRLVPAAQVAVVETMDVARWLLMQKLVVMIVAIQ
jgi:hypothetical protein